MENYANDAGREFGWDDEIQNDSPDRVVLPEGEYPFEVTKFERQRHPGSAKLPPCAMALLTIQIDGGEKALPLSRTGFTCIRGRKDCCAHSSRASASASTGRLCVRAGTK